MNVKEYVKEATTDCQSKENLISSMLHCIEVMADEIERLKDERSQFYSRNKKESG